MIQNERIFPHQHKAGVVMAVVAAITLTVAAVALAIILLPVAVPLIILPTLAVIAIAFGIVGVICTIAAAILLKKGSYKAREIPINDTKVDQFKKEIDKLYNDNAVLSSGKKKDEDKRYLELRNLIMNASDAKLNMNVHFDTAIREFSQFHAKTAMEQEALCNEYSALKNG